MNELSQNIVTKGGCSSASGDQQLSAVPTQGGLASSIQLPIPQGGSSAGSIQLRVPRGGVSVSGTGSSVCSSVHLEVPRGGRCGSASNLRLNPSSWAGSSTIHSNGSTAHSIAGSIQAEIPRGVDSAPGA